MPGDDDILRIAAQFDVGSITAGIDEAASAVRTGTGRMNDSFTSLAAAQIRVAAASKDLRDTLAGTISQGITPTTAATEEVAAAMFEAKTATDAFKAAQEEAYGATQRLAGGVNNSRIAFTGLTQDLGIRGSRALGSFIAQSETLGPILRAAFPIVAAVAFFELLDAGYHKLIDATSALAGWTKEAKAMYEQLVQLNQQQVAFNERLDIEKLTLAEVGLKGSALDQQKLLDLKVQQQIVQNAFNESLKREQSIRYEMSHEEKETIPLSDPATGLPTGEGEITRTITPDKDRTAQLTKELDEAMHKTQELQQEMATLAQVTIPKTGLELVAKDAEEAAKAAQKYQDALAKIRDEETGLTQRNAEKELRDLERVANEKERLDEEMEKTTLDLAKKDLETFEHSLTEKVRMQEEAGRNEIEQIKAQAEAQSKSTEARSFAGAADPKLIAIADTALDQQSFKLMDLIALEEKLRVTLQETGLAETDPKIQESFARQQQLVQQLAVAMQKYDAAVQSVADKSLKSFEKSFDQISNKFNSAIIGWIGHTESFGRAMMKVWDDLATTAITSLLKVGEQELIGVVLHQTLADTEKLTSAKTAAANTYASVSAIPIIGPALAPEAAAVAFAAVMAFEQGGIMGNSEGLALLHPREMVLPSHISDSVQQMASSAGGGGGNTGGSMHVHFHGSQAKEDHAGMEKQLVAMVKRARRRGNL